jgi:putative membrane protein
MLRVFLLSWLVVAAAFAITAWLLSGMTVSGGVAGYLWVSFLFGVINAFVGTFIRILTLPLIFLTAGLLLIVINAVVLAITDALSSDLTIDSFWWTAIWAAIILSLATIVLQPIARKLMPGQA